MRDKLMAFGYGYYSGDKVLFEGAASDGPEELSTEEAVDRFLKESGLAGL